MKLFLKAQVSPIYTYISICLQVFWFLRFLGKLLFQNHLFGITKGH